MSTAGQRISIDILPGKDGGPVTIRVDAEKNTVAAALLSNTNTAQVAQAMLTGAVYQFTNGQPVEFGPEVPLEVLK